MSTAILGTLAFAGVLLLFAAFPLFGAISRFQRARQVRASDPVDARDAPTVDGVVELEGEIEVDPDAEAFRAPFSGAEAVCWSLEIERRRSSDNGSNWRTIHEDEIRRPFRVSDDTGTVELEPAGAELDFESSETLTRRSSDGDLSDDVKLRLSVLTGDLDDVGKILDPGTSKRTRYTEEWLAPGEDVHVYGAEVTSMAGDRPGIDARLTDDPEEAHYGITAGGEWEAIHRDLVVACLLLLTGVAFAAPGVWMLVRAFA